MICTLSLSASSAWRSSHKPWHSEHSLPLVRFLSVVFSCGTTSSCQELAASLCYAGPSMSWWCWHTWWGCWWSWCWCWWCWQSAISTSAMGCSGQAFDSSRSASQFAVSFFWYYMVVVIYCFLGKLSALIWAGFCFLTLTTAVKSSAGLRSWRDFGAFFFCSTASERYKLQDLWWASLLEPCYLASVYFCADLEVASRARAAAFSSSGLS